MKIYNLKYNGLFFSFRSLLWSILFLFSLSVFGQISPNQKVTTGLAQIPWIQNNGQADERIAYYTQTKLGNLKFTNNKNIEYVVRSSDGNVEAIREKFTGNSPLIIPKDPSKVQLNYLKGRMESHRRNIPSFGSLELQGIWPGIQVELSCRGDNMEKLYVIAPGADPGQIRMEWSDITDLCLTDQNELQIDAGFNSLTLTPPIAWQSKDGKIEPVVVRYEVSADHQQGLFSYGFDLGAYDGSAALYIDPLLGSTYSGGELWDILSTVIIDQNNKVLVLGRTFSSDIPTTPGAYDTDYNDDLSEDNIGDIYVMRLSNDLQTIEACTYLGGSEDDIAVGMQLGSNGDIYLAGSTYSMDYPTTPGAYDRTYNGEQGSTIDSYGDIFLSVLSNDLSTLKHSTYFGGENCDYAHAFVLDANNQVYLTGQYGSTMPAVGPQLSQNRTDVVFFMKWSADLSTIQATNTLGYGSIFMGPYGCTLDKDGNFIVVGKTIAFEGDVFPAKPGAISEHLAGGDDGFIIKLSPDLSQNLAASYIGGTLSDVVYRVLTDDAGNIYMSGYTTSASLSGLQGHTAPANRRFDIEIGAFLIKINPAITEILAYMKVHSASYDIFWHSNGNIMACGTSDNSAIQIPCNAIDNIPRDAEGVITFIAPDLSGEIVSTYLGGTKSDGCSDLAEDQEGNIFVTGSTYSTDFPLKNPIDNQNSGQIYTYGPVDGFLCKVTPDLINYTPCCTYITEPGYGATGVPCAPELVWTESDFAEGYYISAGTTAGGKDILDRMDVGNVLSYTLDPLPDRDTVFIRIDAYNAHGVATGRYCVERYFVTASEKIYYESASICEGDTLHWEGFPMTIPGRYEVLHYAANGCDSIVHLDLEIVPCFHETIKMQVCEGDSVSWYGQYYYEPGVYYQYFESSTACDSTYELILERCDQETGTKTKQNGELILYPNPVTNGQLYLKGTEHTPFDLMIVDKNGTQILQIDEYLTGETIPVNALKPGYYLLIVNGKKTNKVFRFVVMDRG